MASGIRVAARLLRRPSRWAVHRTQILLGVLIRHLLMIFVVLGGIAILFGVLGLREHFQNLDRMGEGDFTWANVFFFTFTLFLADGTVYENLGTYPWTLEVARFLAPVATAAGIADAGGALFAHRWEALRARRRHGHAVVCGTTATARALVDKLCADGREVVCIAPDAQAAFPAAAARKRHLLRVSGDAREPAVLARAGARNAEVVYACLDDSAANVAVALSARTLVLSGSGRAPLRCIARVSAPVLVTSLRARRIGLDDAAAFWLDFFAVDEIGARALLDRHLPAWSSASPPRVAVVGLTTFGQALLVELAYRWHLETSQPERTGAAGLRLPVTVVDRSAAATIDGLRRRHAVLDHLSVDTQDVTDQKLTVLDIEEALVGPAAERRPTHVYVCRDDDEAALLTGLEAVRILETTRVAAPRGKVITVIQRRQNFQNAFNALPGDTLPGGPLLDDAAGSLSLFAVSDESLPIDLGATDIRERLAQAIHRRYLDNETRYGDAMYSRPGLRPWEELSKDLQDSNRGQASNFSEILRRCGLTLMPATAGSAPFEFTPAEVDMLARAEHIRWMRQKEAQGFRYGDPSTAGESQKLSLSLRPWEELSERDKDRDRDAVRNMPAVLRDFGLQVVRLAEAPSPPPPSPPSPPPAPGT